MPFQVSVTTIFVEATKPLPSLSYLVSPKYDLLPMYVVFMQSEANLAELAHVLRLAKGKGNRQADRRCWFRR